MTDTTARGAGPAERAQHGGGAGPAPERRRRMSAKRKQGAVLRLLRGEDLELVSRELGVTAAELSAWREGFLAAGEASLKAGRARRRDQPPQGEGRRADDGDRTARGQDRGPGGRPPFGAPEVEAMSRQVSASTNRPYGLLRVARVWGVARATVYRQRRHDEPHPRRRPGPVGPLPDEGLVEEIRALLKASPFHGEGYRKVWARLRLKGVRTRK